jgi:hypothetical protein
VGKTVPPGAGGCRPGKSPADGLSAGKKRVRKNPLTENVSGFFGSMSIVGVEAK